MSSQKRVDADDATVTSSTAKSDEQDESKSSESDNEDTDSNASSEYEVVSWSICKKDLFRFNILILVRKKSLQNVDVVVVATNII